MAREVTHEEYLQFLKAHSSVTIEGVGVRLIGPSTHHAWGPSEDYVPESTTVWSFPDRGDWATHRGDYRGNWSPYIPRNVVLRYTQPGDLVLDQMCGSGTTLVECRLLGRPAIGVDINPDAVMVARDRLAFQGLVLPDGCLPLEGVKTYVGDARHLDFLEDESVSLVVTHPPYANIVAYTRRGESGDLSALSFEAYLVGMQQVATEAFRVLAPGRHCAVLIGDTRKHRHYIPISTRVMELFLAAGFILREDVIKLQWKMKATRERWRGESYDFLKISHEHLYIFRKLGVNEDSSQFKYSRMWPI